MSDTINILLDTINPRLGTINTQSALFNSTKSFHDRESTDTIHAIADCVTDFLLIGSCGGLLIEAQGPLAGALFVCNMYQRSIVRFAVLLLIVVITILAMGRLQVNLLPSDLFSVVISLVIGAVIGQALRLEERLTATIDKLKTKQNKR